MPFVRSKPTGELRAIGLTSGIGSMLVGARQAGFQVVGNVEWRKYYHYRNSDGRNTFTSNFPGAFFHYSLDNLNDNEMRLATGCDLAIGHPECGCFSQLNPNKQAVNNPTDIPLFVKMVSRLRPRFFVMDDLPKSFIAFPIKEYHKLLPDYDLFPEWVSNYHYGNPQRQRKRLFMIGSLKSERFVFRAGEFDHDVKVCDVVGDLLGAEGRWPNHEEHNQDALCAKALHLHYHGHRATWADLAEYVNTHRPGQTIEYHKADGTVATRIGTYKGHWDGHAHVMTGGLSALHPLRGNPFSLRERARIQGFPDDFVFYGTVLDEQGRWEHDRNMHMIRQTGKAMPVQFNRYVCKLIVAHLRKEQFEEATGRRLISPDPYVDEAKTWYCANVGYADQERACNECWLRESCELRSKKTRAFDKPPGTMTATGKLPEEEPGEDRANSSGSVSRPAPPQQVAFKPTLITDLGRLNLVPRATTIKGHQQPTVTAQVKPTHPDARHVMYEEVCVDEGVMPKDYHCTCEYCSVAIGELRRQDGSYYSRNDRRFYYSDVELASTKEPSGHIAKTPLHLARWAIQQYTKVGDWVLDPTAGAGTTIVESVVRGRNAVGVEIQSGDVIRANAAYSTSLVPNGQLRGQYVVVNGDARHLGTIVGKMGVPAFQLVVNNPPYSGDESQKGRGAAGYTYDRSKANLAFLKEGEEYYRTMRLIYAACVEKLRPGGYLVIGVKDQMRNKQPDLLHKHLCDQIVQIDELEFVGTAFLRHHPGTLHLNTYFKHKGVHPPYYQTINVFRKESR